MVQLIDADLLVEYIWAESDADYIEQMDTHDVRAYLDGLKTAVSIVNRVITDTKADYNMYRMFKAPRTFR